MSLNLAANVDKLTEQIHTLSERYEALLMGLEEERVENEVLSAKVRRLGDALMRSKELAVMPELSTLEVT